MAIKITELHHADIFGYFADMLETARLFSSLESGNQLSLGIIEFVQQAAKEAANADEQF